MIRVRGALTLPLPIAAATHALSQVLSWNPTTLGVMDVEWTRWRQLQTMADRCPRFSHVLDESEVGGPGLAVGDTRAALMRVAPEERVGKLAAAMAELVGETLRLPADKVDMHLPLAEMGVDSIAGVNLELTLNATPIARPSKSSASVSNGQIRAGSHFGCGTDLSSERVSRLTALSARLPD